MIRTVDEAGDHFETKHRRKDGSIYNVEISTNGAIFAGQKLIFCVCRDITERVQMEKALRESEEKFSKAFHASPEIIAITTLKEGKFIDFNDTYTANTGYTREELLGRTSKEIDAWADKAERENMIRTLKEEGRVRNKEYRFRTKSGEIRTWLFSAEPINIAGEPCLMGTSMDITERKRMEEALKSSEEKFSKAFNSSPVSLSISRLSDGKLLEVNESFLRNKGYSREEVIGRTARQLGIWAYAEEQNRIINLVKTQGRALNQELNYPPSPGKYAPAWYPRNS
jgi:PAS domain S-box-containing protein